MKKVLNKIDTSLDKLLSLKIYKYLVVPLLVIVMLIWWVLSGIILVDNSHVIQSNTQRVLSDKTAIKVSSVSNNSLVLENSDTVEAGSIDSYIRTSVGLDSYYIPEGMLSVSLTIVDSLSMCVEYLIVELGLIFLIYYLAKKNFYLVSFRKSYMVFSIFMLYSLFVRYYYLGIFSIYMNALNYVVLFSIAILVGQLDWFIVLRVLLDSKKESS